ncbi:YbjQ family protein [Celeribacter marinus]|uniref:YbjQ family protein n=1 Tax=Celeribacter marinus TaxID=1397108 RepID=UPI003F6ADEE9
MAKCQSCGIDLGLLNRGRLGFCKKCDSDGKAFGGGAFVQLAEIEAILLTTETVPNLNITKRIEIITAECAFGMNIFKDLFAGVRDIVGGRSEAVQKTMRDSRRTALYELKREAYEVGANAVVGVDLDYVELSSAGSMVMLVASGTAVVIEE